MKTEEIARILEPILESRQLFLVDLKISKNNVVEIYIDALNGVDIGTCTAVSREIESSLDRNKEDYELTVASAGIGYPFKTEIQYKKNIGHAVEIELKDSTRLAGTLLRFDAEEVTIEREEKQKVEGTSKKQTVKTERTISRNEIKTIKESVAF